MKIKILFLFFFLTVLGNAEARGNMAGRIDLLERLTKLYEQNQKAKESGQLQLLKYADFWQDDPVSIETRNQILELLIKFNRANPDVDLYVFSSGRIASEDIDIAKDVKEAFEANHSKPVIGEKKKIALIVFDYVQNFKGLDKQGLEIISQAVNPVVAFTEGLSSCRLSIPSYINQGYQFIENPDQAYLNFIEDTIKLLNYCAKGSYPLSTSFASAKFQLSLALPSMPSTDSKRATNSRSLNDYAGLSGEERKALADWLNTFGKNARLIITSSDNEQKKESEPESMVAKIAADIDNGRWGNEPILVWLHFDKRTNQVWVRHEFKPGALQINPGYARIGGVPTSLGELKKISDDEVKKAVDAGNGILTRTPATESLGLLQRIVMVKDFTKDILGNLKVPEAMWNSADGSYNSSPVNIAPILGGAGDGTFEELKSLPDLLALGIDLAVDKQLRNTLVEKISSISVDEVKNLASNFYEEKKKTYATLGTDKSGHQAGKDVVSLATIFIPITKAGKLKKGAELAEESGEGLGKLIKQISEKLQEKIGKLPGDQKNILIKELQENADLLKKLDESPELVDAWKKLDDAGLTALRKDPIQLQKFDDIAKNNNLGLDADGLGDLLKSPQAKGLTWDNPDKVLDAVKRSSDANIQGFSISHKKFPAPANGTDNFVLKNAKQFQAEASGDAALSFNKNGVSFDNVAADGKLVDRKFGHSSSIFDKVDDGFETIYQVTNQDRARSLLEQAQRQINSVGDGSKIRWEISTQDGANGIKQLFSDPNRLSEFPGVDKIEVVYKAQITIIP
jgi:hypothetical protein